MVLQAIKACGEWCYICYQVYTFNVVESKIK